MKWLWLLGVIIVYFAYYVFSYLAFMTEMDIIAVPVVIGGGISVVLITNAFIKEYFI